MLVQNALLATLLAATIGCTSSLTQEGTGEYLDGTWITTRIKAALLNESTLKSAEINVEAFKGQVQLSGLVNSSRDISKPVEIARSTRDVKSVKNDMCTKGQ